jgi:hypothetical protein
MRQKEASATEQTNINNVTSMMDIEITIAKMKNKKESHSR